MSLLIRQDRICLRNLKWIEENQSFSKKDLLMRCLTRFSQLIFLLTEVFPPCHFSLLKTLIFPTSLDFLNLITSQKKLELKFEEVVKKVEDFVSILEAEVFRTFLCVFLK